MNVLTVAEGDEIIIVTTSGMVVRCPVSQIRTSGRNAVGVHVMRLKDKDKIASATRVVAKEEEEADASQLELLDDKASAKKSSK